MRSIRYASPTFLFRDTHANQLMQVIEQIARCGYDGFELYGLFGEDPAAIRKKCDDVGICVMGDHVPYTEFASDTDKVIQSRVILGTPYITIDKIPPEHLPGGPHFPETVKTITRIGEACKAAGLQLLYHNHGYDLIDGKKDGKYVLEWILDSIDAELLKFQPDLGWIELGGGENSYFLDKYRERICIVHLKDYYSTAPMRLSSAPALGYNRGGPELNNFEFRPTGYGVVNFAKYMPQVLACNPAWLVADHDLSYERDVFTDLKDSVDFVKKLVHLYPNF
jgi:sugar phosphate isomerase/epimerase